MIDVGAYLPHDAESDLVHIDASLKLTENLPVLDGAAALLPVYAAFVDAVYPIGSVTYEGGAFSDDNFYGENFAEDSKIQYNNTVRGYQAIVDGTTDILFCAAPSTQQEQYAREKGVDLIYVPIGLEAFVFFVNETVTRLSDSGIQSAMVAFMGNREIALKSPFAITGASIEFSFRFIEESGYVRIQ